MDSDGEVYSDNESENRQVEDINPNDTDDDMNDASDGEDEGGEDRVAEEPLEPVNIQVIVPEDERITSNMMTKFEFAEIVGTRAQQIDATGQYFANLANHNKGQLDAKDVAVLELLQKRCPLLIKRHIDSKYIEMWNPNDMIIPKVNIQPYID